MYLFVAIFQVAQNPPKFGMPTVFVLKKCPCAYFPQGGNKVSNTFFKL